MENWPRLVAMTCAVIGIAFCIVGVLTDDSESPATCQLALTGYAFGCVALVLRLAEHLAAVAEQNRRHARRSSKRRQ